MKNPFANSPTMKMSDNISDMKLEVKRQLDELCGLIGDEDVSPSTILSAYMTYQLFPVRDPDVFVEQLEKFELVQLSEQLENHIIERKMKK